MRNADKPVIFSGELFGQFYAHWLGEKHETVHRSSVFFTTSHRFAFLLVDAAACDFIGGNVRTRRRFGWICFDVVTCCHCCCCWENIVFTVVIIVWSIVAATVVVVISIISSVRISFHHGFPIADQFSSARISLFTAVLTLRWEC